jgi:ABC-2 type transport system ATP-binding protein
MSTTSVSRLTVRYGSTAVLRDVTIRFETGVTALLGVNGCGKTTLLRTLATLQPPAAGEVVVADESLDNRGGVERARASLGYLDQHARFPGRYTVADAVAYSAWLHRVPRNRRAVAVAAAMEQHDLFRWRNARLSTLSGGTRRRVCIAQASVHDPAVLLLDEPSAGLDIDQRHLLRTSIGHQATSRVVVLATHDVDDVLEIADQIVILVHGSVRFAGRLDALVPTAERAQIEQRLREHLVPR